MTLKSASQLERECTPAERIEHKEHFDNYYRINASRKATTQDAQNKLGNYLLMLDAYKRMKTGGMN